MSVPANTKFVAPFPTLLKMSEFHGALSDYEIVELLENANHNDYLVCNYDPSNPEGHFTVCTKYKLNGFDHVLKEFKFKIRIPILPHYAQQYRTHGSSGKMFKTSHSLTQCIMGKRHGQPILRKTPPTLMECARGVISYYIRHDHKITPLVQSGQIPKEVADFLLQHSTNTPPTFFNYVFCEEFLCNFKSTAHFNAKVVDLHGKQMMIHEIRLTRNIH